jgi:prepilin-type N-terminal cleavage/methylation domain-containing protein
MKHRKHGFSLIEVMICIALLAIILPVAFSVMNSFRWFAGEENYKYALFQAKNQAKLLRSMPFDSLPPEVKTIPSTGTFRLSQSRVLPETVKIYCGGQPLLEKHWRIEGNEVKLSGSFAGKTVVIEYGFALPDSGEAVTVPRKPPCEVTLLNSPVREIEEIRSVSGTSFSALSPGSYSLDKSRGTVVFDKSLSGKVIECDYYGGRMGNYASGTFLTEKLQPSRRPTDIKTISITETYGGNINRFKISFLKVRR